MYEHLEDSSQMTKLWSFRRHSLWYRSHTPHIGANWYMKQSYQTDSSNPFDKYHFPFFKCKKWGFCEVSTENMIPNGTQLFFTKSGAHMMYDPQVWVFSLNSN